MNIDYLINLKALNFFYYKHIFVANLIFLTYFFTITTTVSLYNYGRHIITHNNSSISLIVTPASITNCIRLSDPSARNDNDQHASDITLWLSW